MRNRAMTVNHQQDGEKIIHEATYNLMSDSSGQQSEHYLVVVEVRMKLAVSKQTTHRFHTAKFNLKKLNKVENKSSIVTDHYFPASSSNIISHTINFNI
jgi:hypothetical protein